MAIVAVPYQRRHAPAGVGQPPADAAQLLVPARAQRLFEIVRAVAAWRQQRASMPVEVGG